MKIAPEKQQRAIELMLEGKSPLEVAEELGVTDRTLRNWRQDPGFREALAAAQKARWEATLRQLVGISTKAVATLHDLMTSEKTPLQNRINFGT